jgi:hypothetical protein
MIRSNSLYGVSGYTHPCTTLTGSHPYISQSISAIPESAFFLETCGVCGATRRMAQYSTRPLSGNGLGGRSPRRGTSLGGSYPGR